MNLSLFKVQSSKVLQVKVQGSARPVLPPDRAYLFGAILVQSIFSAQRCGLKAEGQSEYTVLRRRFAGPAGRGHLQAQTSTVENWT